MDLMLYELHTPLGYPCYPAVVRTMPSPQRQSITLSHYALEAWERMTNGGAVVEPERRRELHSLALVRGLMERAIEAHERSYNEAMDRVERDFCRR